MNDNRPRLISFVPSWTETLIEAGANVVGRTRFCIHPANKVASIPSVGGTKDFNLIKLIELRPDFIILDKQENTLEMANALQGKGIPLLISNVQSQSSASDFLSTLAGVIDLPVLSEWSDRYRNINGIDSKKFFDEVIVQGAWPKRSPVRFDYVIWQNPWMVVGKNTFIAENLNRAEIQLTREAPYPEVDENDLIKSFCLFSSEPFPFAKNFAELMQKGFHGVVVDGEKLSWFGIKNLLFLERCLK